MSINCGLFIVKNTFAKADLFMWLSQFFIIQEGYGIGDDEYSLAYDGCRNLIWYEAQCTPLVPTQQQWKSGDILGCLLNIEAQQVIFSLNGVALPPDHRLFNSAK